MQTGDKLLALKFFDDDCGSVMMTRTITDYSVNVNAINADVLVLVLREDVCVGLHLGTILLPALPLKYIHENQTLQ